MFRRFAFFCTFGVEVEKPGMRVRRSLFGQSLVDFTADPWVGLKNGSDRKVANAQKKTKKKLSRLEREFSQRDSQLSQATTIIESTPCDEPSSPSVEKPDGTVYFSEDLSYF